MWGWVIDLAREEWCPGLPPRILPMAVIDWLRRGNAASRLLLMTIQSWHAAVP